MATEKTENKYVLFSPIGDTDPVRDGHDGPMLHIVRHYRPHAVYLFYTDEMWKRIDSRQIEKAKYIPNERNLTKPALVRESLVTLKEEEQVEFILEERHAGIQKAHLFDEFREHFADIIDEISEKHPDSQILVNISSGTPAIKSTLAIESVVSKHSLKSIQVASPRQASNIGIAHGGDPYETVDGWRDEHGNRQADNRCLEPDLKTFRLATIKSEIKSLIASYDYQAAYTILSSNKNLFQDYIELSHLLRYAGLRQRDREEYKNNMWHKEFDYYTNLPEKTDKEKAEKESVTRAVDYYNILHNKASVGEHSYFILLLQSWLEFVAEYYVKDIRHPARKDILDTYYMEKNGTKYKPTPPYKGRQIYSLEQYMEIMRVKNYELRPLYEALSIVIRNQRNDLAHNLSTASDINVDEILAKMKGLLAKTYKDKYKERYLDLYSDINAKIDSLL